MGADWLGEYAQGEINKATTDYTVKNGLWTFRVRKNEGEELTPKTAFEFDLKTGIRFLKRFDFIVGRYSKMYGKKRCVSVSGKKARKYTLIFNSALMRSEQKKISNCTQLGNFSHTLAFAQLTAVKFDVFH